MFDPREAARFADVPTAIRRRSDGTGIARTSVTRKTRADLANPSSENSGTVASPIA